MLDPDIEAGRLDYRSAAMHTFRTNVVSPHVLTRALMPLLFAGSSRRLIFVSSGMSSIADMSCADALARAPAAGWPKAQHETFSAYRASKSALNMVAADWRLELRNDGFKVHVVSPGFVLTSLGGIDADTQKDWGAGDAADSGQFVRDVIAGNRDAEQDLLIDVKGAVPY